MKRTFSEAEARGIGEELGIDFSKVDIEQFRIGLSVELEHGTENPKTNVTDDDIALTAKIAWAHLNELPDYYKRLTNMEREAKTSLGQAS
jgi:hypothetical protein